MNYYKKVAEMLGVELNEEFKVAYSDGVLCENPYKITLDGIFYKNALGWLRSSFLHDIIEGNIKIVKMPWKPKVGDQYYIYSIGIDHAVETTFTACTMDYLYWKTGNCFRTKEEAETKGYEIMKQIIEERNL